MSFPKNMVQPGAILHEVIVGAFRAKGTSFSAWCAQNKIHQTTAKQATYGQSGGDRGKAILGAMIRDAGPAVVEAAYRQRMEVEFKRLNCTASGDGVAA